MRQKELNELNNLIELIKETEGFAEDILPKDQDGGYTHNSMALLFRISHIKRELEKSLKNKELKIDKDYY